MSGPRSYRELDVWALAMSVAESCYRTTREFPKDELYAMTSQIRRASASIPANIAEGYGRESTADYVRFLRMAQGPVKELETHLLLAQRVELLSEEKATRLLGETDRVAKMLGNQIRALQAKMSS